MDDARFFSDVLTVACFGAIVGVVGLVSGDVVEGFFGATSVSMFIGVEGVNGEIINSSDDARLKLLLRDTSDPTFGR